MSISNGIISAPISANDPYDLLGVPKQLSGWDLGYINSNAHGKINPFSKKKPVNLSTYLGSLEGGYFIVNVPDLPQFKYSTDWWRSYNGRCGFVLPSSSIVVNPNSPDGVWGYDAPEGGSTYPYRLIDFEGYNHNAVYNLITVNPPKEVVKDRSLNIGVTIPTMDSSNISLQDVFNSSLGINTKLYISIKAVSNPTDLHYVKEIPNIVGNHIVSFTDAEISSIGLVVNGKLWVHLYGAIDTGSIVSLRTHNNVATIWSLNCVSSKPYNFVPPRGQILRDPSNQYLYYIWNLAFGITAVGYEGGTLERGSYIKCFIFKSDSTEYRNENAIWTSTAFEAVNVTSGNTTLLPLSYSYNVNVQADPFPYVIFIWYDAKNIELSRYKNDVRIGTP